MSNISKSKEEISFKTIIRNPAPPSATLYPFYWRCNKKELLQFYHYTLLTNINVNFGNWIVAINYTRDLKNNRKAQFPLTKEEKILLEEYLRITNGL